MEERVSALEAKFASLEKILRAAALEERVVSLEKVLKYITDELLPGLAAKIPTPSPGRGNFTRERRQNYADCLKVHSRLRGDVSIRAACVAAGLPYSTGYCYLTMPPAKILELRRRHLEAGGVIPKDLAAADSALLKKLR
jgi:hypothetical protein